jgi:hypothetical protein
MKEEIGHLPDSAILCHCCRTQLSWIEINNKCKELFYSYSSRHKNDYYKYSNSYKEYICDACVRDGKINAILSY